MLWEKDKVRDVARIMPVRIRLIQKNGIVSKKARQSEKVSAKALRQE